MMGLAPVSCTSHEGPKPLYRGHRDIQRRLGRMSYAPCCPQEGHVALFSCPKLEIIRKGGTFQHIPRENSDMVQRTVVALTP